MLVVEEARLQEGQRSCRETLDWAPCAIALQAQRGPVEAGRQPTVPAVEID